MKKLFTGTFMLASSFCLPAQIISCAPHVDLTLNAKVQTKADGIHALSQASLEQDLSAAIQNSALLSEVSKKSALEKLAAWLSQSHHFHVGSSILLLEVKTAQGLMTLEIVTERAEE